jgi:hypothetical protein
MTEPSRCRSAAEVLRDGHRQSHPDCRWDGPHFVPPSMGDPGFFLCDAGVLEPPPRPMTDDKRDEPNHAEELHRQIVEEVGGDPFDTAALLGDEENARLSADLQDMARRRRLSAGRDFPLASARPPVPTEDR